MDFTLWLDVHAPPTSAEEESPAAEQNFQVII